MAGHVFRSDPYRDWSIWTDHIVDGSVKECNAAGQLQFDHPLFDTFDLVRITHEDLDIGGRFTRNLTAINGVMSFRIRDGQGLTAREPEISVQAMRREGSLTPCYNADRDGTDITVIGDGQPQPYGFIKMLAGCMQMVAGSYRTAAAHGTKGIVARGLPGTRLFTTENNVRFGTMGGCRALGAQPRHLDWRTTEPGVGICPRD